MFSIPKYKLDSNAKIKRYGVVYNEPKVSKSRLSLIKNEGELSNCFNINVQVSKHEITVFFRSWS